jgi:hypothetical protein
VETKHLAGARRHVPSIATIVIDQVRRLLATPEVVVASWKAARQATKKHYGN